MKTRTCHSEYVACALVAGSIGCGAYDPMANDPEPSDQTYLAMEVATTKTVTLFATIDTEIRQESRDTNYGGAASITVDGSPSADSKDRSALLKWNVTSIPKASEITKVELILNLTNPTSQSFYVYALKRDWTEPGATWNSYRSGSSWHIPGARGTDDREEPVLGTVTGAVGDVTIELNAEGRRVLTQWVYAWTNANFGLLIEGSTQTDGFIFRSSENTSSSLRPRLRVTYNEASSVVAAGDIGDEGDDDVETGNLLANRPTAAKVITLGDAANPNGSNDDYNNVFNPAWGTYKSRIRPVPGNHDYLTSGADGYFDYFGTTAAGARDKGYYSYNWGDWHVVALNSVCKESAGGTDRCSATSTQVTWLRADLAANTKPCTLAVLHHGRYSSGQHGDNNEYDESRGTQDVRNLWEELVDAHVDVVLSGHDHDYERWAPMDNQKNYDSQGVRQFIVGTGGSPLRSFPGSMPANSEYRSDSEHGLLTLYLGANFFGWEFNTTLGALRLDAGYASCH